MDVTFVRLPPGFAEHEGKRSERWAHQPDR